MSKNAAIDLNRSDLAARRGTVIAALLIPLLLTPMNHSTSAVTHDQVLRRARVWKEPSTSIEEAKLDQNPGGPGSFAVDEVVDYTFKPALYPA